jgi:DNA-binding MarR family transcriptional regulator
LKALSFWHAVVAGTVRGDSPDMTMRQLALLLTVYLDPPPHTVRGLSTMLGLPKPAVTRALDTLGRQGFLKRVRDPRDKRNVLVQRTVAGSVFLRDHADHIIRAWQGASPYDHVFRNSASEPSASDASET